MWEVEREIIANFTATVEEIWPNINNNNIPDDDNDITIPLLIAAVSINLLFNIGNITYSCCKNKNKNLDDEEDSDNDSDNDDDDIGDLDIDAFLNGLENKRDKRDKRKKRKRRKKKNYYDQV